MTSPVYFAQAKAFRAWLAKNHAKESELLVGFHKVGSGKPSMTWPESVDEALCFGWIDGVRRRIDEERYSIRFTPRKPRSIWSAVNVKRVAALTQERRMAPAGLAAYERRAAAHSGIYSYERPAEVKLTPAFERRLREDKAARAFFAKQPPSYRKAATHWVMSAKKEETRERRLATLISCSAAAEPIPPLRWR